MKKIVLLLSIFALSACSGGGGGGDQIPGAGLPAPTDEQKDRMGQFGQEMVDVQNATAKENSKVQSDTSQSQTGGSSPKPLAADFLSPMSMAVKTAKPKSSSGPVGPSENGKQLEEMVQKAIYDTKECLVETQGIPEPGQSKPAPRVEITPFGMGAPTNYVEVVIGNGKSKCPIFSQFSIKTTGQIVENGESANGTVGIEFRNSFKVHEWADFYKDMLIRGYDMFMGFSMTVNANQNSATVNFSGSGETSIDSRPDFEGAVSLKNSFNMNVSGNQNGSSMNMQVVSDYTFKDFRVVGVIRASMTGNSEQMNIVYYINGDKVTEQEYFELFSGTATSDSVMAQGESSSPEFEEVPSGF